MIRVHIEGGGDDWDYLPSDFATMEEAVQKVAAWGDIFEANLRAGDTLPPTLVLVLEHLDGVEPSPPPLSIVEAIAWRNIFIVPEEDELEGPY